MRNRTSQENLQKNNAALNPRPSCPADLPARSRPRRLVLPRSLARALDCPGVPVHAHTPLPQVRFNCKLLQLRQEPGGCGWSALYLDTATQRFYSLSADFVVVATGLYSHPFVPNYEVGSGRARCDGLTVYGC